MKNFAIFFSLYALCTVTNAELTGDIRKNFLDGYVHSCYATQRNASVNKSTEGYKLYQYCKCAGLYLAENLNNELLKSIDRGEQKLNPNLTNMAANYCQKNYSLYK